MELDRLTALQQELYAELTASSKIKIGLNSPPWDRETFNKAIKFALFLTNGEQSIITNDAGINSWLDKFSFHKQGVNQERGCHLPRD
jgi:hypothetical protein